MVMKKAKKFETAHLILARKVLNCK
ncbi:uncharacterized protein METZ01_LOCUS55942 [marine metagenome]|uniref:Uncharacterized protein n=1 Tax=marine metagenome TaxID=408172 RepID=A0A381SII0_9ZZZZ